ncbi:SPOR domain-containing protein [Vibrio rumoiensis]|uniref:SPOR domain-containing protein n=1 Tax=Vibrio rumoiensis 1S-45 TaxID=1188252 RepID=A0A1E5E501_9VIBR|nr:SPOR domain-containing protein [Vibrio rumoiensis]OEF27631.1 hypothetical protein A1QC_06255 [Vibrio rumoiensis 1S-45]
MKKIAIISLSVLLLSACSSSDYDNEVTTETYQETFKTDEVPQPITESSVAPIEEDIQTVNTASVAEPSMVEPKVPEVANSNGKKVVKLSPPNNSMALEQPGTNSYLIQIAALENEQHLLSTAANLPKSLPKWENVKTVNGKQWHSLLVGDFSTAQDAKDALMKLPASYQSMGPFVKSVKSISSSPYPDLKKLP